MKYEYYNIRQAKTEDMEYLIKLAQNEGWNLGLKDGKAFFAADPNGFFIGEYNHEPIACISAVRYNGFGFIGFYIVEEDFRGNGFGLALWQHAMNYLSGCNIGLDGIVSQQKNYQKSGFKLAHPNLRFKGSNFPRPTPEMIRHIISAPLADFNNLLAYDTAHFPTERETFLRSWIAMDTAKPLIYQENNQIKGMGMIRQCQHGCKIGPLFAETPEIAEALFLSMVPFSESKPVFIDIYPENNDALNLVKKYNMKLNFEAARMYTQKIPDLPWNEVYGITTFELG